MWCKDPHPLLGQTAGLAGELPPKTFAWGLIGGAAVAIIGLALAIRHIYASHSAKQEVERRLELAEMLYLQDNLAQAATHYRQLLVLDPNCVEALNNLAFILATASDDALRNGPEAVRLAEQAMLLPPVEGMCVAGTLAAAYAEVGRFPEAVAAAENALRRETTASTSRFADLLEQFLSYYRAGKVWHGTMTAGVENIKI